MKVVSATLKLVTGRKANPSILNYAQARGPHAEWPTISEAVYTATQSVFIDNTDPAEALAKAMETIAPIVAENPLP